MPFEIQFMLSFAFLVYDHLQKLLPGGKKNKNKALELFFKGKVGQD